MVCMDERIRVADSCEHHQAASEPRPPRVLRRSRFAEGPIENPAEPGPALKWAIQVVKSGEPALVDMLTQPR